MGDHSSIEWTEATWNPIVGCSLESPGCTNCYAMSMARRIEAMMSSTHYAGTTKVVNGHAVWTGKVALAPEHILAQPLRWRRPRKIFVNSMGDLFHESVPDAWIDRVFAVMALTSQHTYQVLTKRSARMRAYLSDQPGARRRWEDVLHAMGITHRSPPIVLRNVWLGVSTEDQRRADERVPDLLATPAAVRFVSAEPLLGPLDFTRLGTLDSIGRAFPEVVEQCQRDARPSSVSAMQIDSIGGSGQATIFHQTPDHMGGFAIRFPRPFPRLDWIIAGGESGPGARPMHPDWVRAIREQCAADGVPFFFKQWGAHAPLDRSLPVLEAGGRTCTVAWPDGTIGPGSVEARGGPGQSLFQGTKKITGRLLDGREHNAMPAGQP